MAFIIIGTVVGFAAVWKLCNCTNEAVIEDYFMSALGGVAGLLLGFIIWLTIGGLIGYNLPVVENIEEQEVLYLNLPSYTVNTENGYQTKQIPDKSVVIVGDYEPMIKIHEFSFKEDWYYWFAHDLFIKNGYMEFFMPKSMLGY